MNYIATHRPVRRDGKFVAREARNKLTMNLNASGGDAVVWAHIIAIIGVCAIAAVHWFVS